MGHAVNLFLDFDDVINVEGIAKPRNRGKLPPIEERFQGLKHGFVHIQEGNFLQRFDISHHTEVIDFINALTARGVLTVWLSTWERYTATALNPYLGTDFDYIPWSPEVEKSPEYVAAAKLGSHHLDEYVTATRDARKLAEVQAATAASGKPFIWIDDSATLLHRAADFSVPSLAVTPNPVYGIGRADAEAISRFLDDLEF